MVSMRRRKFIILFGGAAAGWPLWGTLSSRSKCGASGISTMERVYCPAAALHLSTTPIGANPSWRDCGNLAGSRDKTLPLSDVCGGPSKSAPCTCRRTRCPQRRRDAGSGHPGSQGCAGGDQQDRHRDGRPRRRGAARACRQPCTARANITGVTSLAPELATKRLALLKEAFPKTARVAVLWNSAIPPAEVALKELRAAAPTLGVRLAIRGSAGTARVRGGIRGHHARTRRRVVRISRSADIRQQRIDHRLRQQEFDPRSVRRTREWRSAA